MALKDLRPFHLQQWVDSHPDWNPGMKRGRMQAVQRALNWAVKQGRIEKSPIAFVEKPPPGKREVVIDYPTYQRMLDLTWTQEFRDLITVSWETGCRPQEIWRVAGSSPPRNRRARRRSASCISPTWRSRSASGWLPSFRRDRCSETVTACGGPDMPRAACFSG
jgi:integrase